MSIELNKSKEINLMTWTNPKGTYVRDSPSPENNKDNNDYYKN